MKKIITICLLGTSTLFFAQKNEIKALDKAIKKADFTAAKSASNAAEALIGNMDDKTKAKFYYLKAKAFYAGGGATNSNDVDTAIQSISELTMLESKMGKVKYSQEAEVIKTEMTNMIITKSNAAFEAKQFKDAAIGFEKVYKISPKDTAFLFNAAYAAVQAKDYDLSLKHYIKLKDIGYTGIRQNYFATNKETNEEERFADKITRDLSVKAGTHLKPLDKKSESVRGDIIKNIAVIYILKGDNEKAIAAIEDAKKQNPNDYNLILSEANVYLQLGNEAKAFELYKKALSMDPSNPDLNYNVGIMTMNAKQYDDAKTYFNQAIELKPDYADAYLNISSIQVNKGNDINDEMNNLGNSKADNIKYEKLRDQKNDLFIAGAKVLEDYISKYPKTKNIDIYTQLRNIYSALGEVDKYKSYKAKIEALEAEAASQN